MLVQCLGLRHRPAVSMLRGLLNSPRRHRRHAIDTVATPPTRRSNGIGIRVPGGSVNLTKGDEVALKYYLATRGPVSIAFDVASDFRDYKSGVYSSTICAHDAEHVNHAVLAVGYGVDPVSAKPYWLIKNSWDYTWGLCGHQPERHRADAATGTTSRRWRGAPEI